MANFHTHYRVGVLFGVIPSVILFTLGILSFVSSVIFFILSIIGSLLPDIDIPTSKPAKYMFVTISSTIVYFVGTYLYSIYQVYIIFFICFILFFILEFLLPKILKKITFHRGIVHSVPMLVFLVFFICIFLYRYMMLDEVLSWIFAISVGYGYFIHLALDEIYSVNIFGRKMKKSFGSAMKLYDKKEKIYSLILYISIIIEYFYLPSFVSIKDIFNIVSLYLSA
jgi:hypothetical protein